MSEQDGWGLARALPGPGASVLSCSAGGSSPSLRCHVGSSGTRREGEVPGNTARSVHPNSVIGRGTMSIKAVVSVHRFRVMSSLQPWPRE